MSSPPALADLRADIDRIDAEMHRLLMERGDIIGTLIAIKKTAESGSAFRPAREADMMRRLVERHHGILPLDTAESIWRVIIATFTYVQAPFRVHADLSAGDAAMRDSCTLPFRFHGAVRRPYGAGRRRLGGRRIQGRSRTGARPARRRPCLVERARRPTTPPRSSPACPSSNALDHPAGLPVYAIARPASRRRHPRGRNVEPQGLRLGGRVRRGRRRPSPTSSPCRRALSTAPRCFCPSLPGPHA